MHIRSGTDPPFLPGRCTRCAGSPGRWRPRFPLPPAPQAWQRGRPPRAGAKSPPSAAQSCSQRSCDSVTVSVGRTLMAKHLWSADLVGSPWNAVL